MKIFKYKNVLLKKNTNQNYTEYDLSHPSDEPSLRVGKPTPSASDREDSEDGGSAERSKPLGMKNLTVSNKSAHACPF